MTQDPNDGSIAGEPLDTGAPPSEAAAPAASPDEPSTSAWPADPVPGLRPTPIYAEPVKEREYLPGPSGWVVPGQPSGAYLAPPRAIHPVVQAIVWIVGLGGLIVVALTIARLREPTQSGSYAFGYAAGTLIAALAVGFVAQFVLRRVRTSSGHPSLNRMWAIPIAGAALLFQLAIVPTRTAVVPRSTPPPAQLYAQIGRPYSLVATTSEDVEMVARTQQDVGKNGISDARVMRITAPGRGLTGYLVVMVNVAAADDPDAAMSGFLFSLKLQLHTPTMTTIGGHSVAMFDSSNGLWSAAWFDGPFVAEVIASDKDSATVLAQAVMDAQ